MASDLSAGVRVPSMHPYRCIRVPEGVKMASSLSATIYEPDVSPMEPAGMKIVMHLSAIMYEPAGVFLVSMHP